MKKEVTPKCDVFGTENSLERSEEEFSVIIVLDKVNEVCLSMLKS